jgi:tRNA threonylcarbamoyladenosine biosynthesis protein TsaB
MELSIDTSSRYAGVALSWDGEPRWEMRWHSSQNHTRELAGVVEALTARAGVTIGELGAVFVAEGPGGFSAVRVGMGFAKGLAESRDVPLVGVSTLEVEALPYEGLGRPVCPLLEVGRGLVAWARFRGDDGGWRREADEAVVGVEELVGSVPEGAVLCGEGAWAHAALLRDRLGGRAAVVASPPPTRQLWALARLGAEALAEGRADDRATLQPRYLRQPSITPPRPR